MRRMFPKVLIPVLFLGILVISTGAFAQMGMGRGMGMGKGMMNLTPEQAAQVFDLRQQFMNDTANVRKQMWVKRAEMAQLWKAEKPDEKAIVAKQKEMHALKGQMMEKSVAFRLADPLRQALLPDFRWTPIEQAIDATLDSYR